MNKLYVIIICLCVFMQGYSQHILRQKADELLMSGKYQEALGYYQNDLETIELIKGKNSLDCVYDLQSIASCYMQLSKYKEAIMFLTRGMEIIKNVNGIDNKDYYNLLYTRSIVYKLKGELQNALADAKVAHEIISKIYGENSKEYLEVASLYADKLEINDILDQAFEYACKAKELVLKFYSKSSSQYQFVLLTLSNIYDKAGMLEEKCKNSIELYESYEQSYGKLDEYTVGALRVLGHDYSALKEYDKAIAVFTDLVGRVKETGDIDQLITELRVLSSFYCDKDDYEGARNVTKEECVVAQSLNDKVRLAESLRWFVYLSQQLKDWDTCLENEKKVLEIYKSERPLSEDHLLSLSQIAFFLEQKGNYASKLSFTEEVAELYEKNFGKLNDDYLHQIMGIARLKGLLGDFKGAAKIRKENVDLIKQFYGANSEMYLAFVHNMYTDDGDAGNLRNIIKQMELLAETRKRIEGEYSEGYISTLNNLAVLYFRLDMNVKAMETTERIIELRQQHGDVASLVTALDNAGSIYGQCGIKDKELDSYTKAYKLCDDFNLTSTPQYALLCTNFAQSLFSLPKYSEFSQALLLEAEALNDSIWGPDHPTTLHNKALRAQWEYFYGSKEMSIIILEDIILFSLKKSNNTSTSFYAFIANELASSLYEFDVNTTRFRTKESFSDKDKKAMDLAKSAYDVRRKIYGEHHSATISSLLTLMTCAEKNDKSLAISYLERYYDQQLEFLRTQLSTMTAEERYYFWLSNNQFYTSMLQRMAVTTGNDRVRQLAYDGCLISKGLLLHTDMTIEDIVMSSKDDELKEMYRAYLGNKNNKDLEKKVLERCSKYGNITSFIDNVSWKTIQKKLGPKDIAIEFSSYMEDRDTTYIALCITNNQAPTVYELCSKKDLERISLDTSYWNASLWNLCWEKLQDILNDKENVYFSPDGLLHNIAIEYFQDKDGVMASDRWNVYRLSSTAILANSGKNSNVNSIALYGGLRYDVDLESMEEESLAVKKYADKFVSRSANLLSPQLYFTYLPNTKVEVESIYEIANNTKLKTSLFTDVSGNEESFYSIGAQSINVLHFATHGFYWTETEAKDRINEIRFIEDSKDSKSVEDKAMSRSGLILSGGNATLLGNELPADVEDGILTAAEISEMNLSSCDMVALSACQTGLGDNNYSEGVFGLQRGFKKAGVNSILMTLWEVDDMATKELMVEFYKHLLSGESKISALRKAQNYLRSQKKYEAPKYWAGFILLDGIN